MTMTTTTIDRHEDLTLTPERIERLANEGIFDQGQAETMRAPMNTTDQSWQLAKRDWFTSADRH